MSQFRSLKGEILFSDGHSDMYQYSLEKKIDGKWEKVLSLELESQRMSEGKIDILYRHRAKKEQLLIHVDNLGSDRISDYYISYDGGLRWYGAYLEKEPDEKEYSKEFF